jgi:hypothetical protein
MLDLPGNGHRRSRARWLLLPAAAAVVSVLACRPAPAGADAAPAGPDVLTGVACLSANRCTAVNDAGQRVTFDGVSPGITNPRTTAAHSLFGVACPTVGQCTAFDVNRWNSDTAEVTFHPTAVRTPKPIAIDTNATAISCPTRSQCTIVDGEGGEVTFNPTAPRHATSSVLDVDDDVYPAPIGLNGVACPTADECVAVDENGQELTFDPRHPPPSYNYNTDSGGGTANGIDANPLIAIACPAVRQCTAVDDSGGAVTFDPTHPNATPVTQACPTTLPCTAVDAAGNAMTFDPISAGASPTLDPIDPGTELLGIACPSASLCTAVGGTVEVTFDPTVAGSPGPVVIDTGPDATAARAQATGFGAGHAELSFTLTAAADASAIARVQLTPPAGISFSPARGRLARGTTVTAGATTVRATTRLSGGRLTIALGTPARTVTLTIARPAIVPTTTLADRIKTGRLRTVVLPILATNTALATTQLTVRAPVHGSARIASPK